MDEPEHRMSMARLVTVEVVLVAVFPASASLVASRSSLPVPSSFGAWWRADLVGVVAPVLWLGGFALSVWLLTTMLAYAWAARRGHSGLRRLVGAFTAPAVRRAIDAALVVSIGTVALVSAPRAFAVAGPVAVPTTTSSPAAPVVRSGSATTADAGAPTAPFTPTATAPPASDGTGAPSGPAAPVVRAGGPRPSGETAPPSLRTSPDLRQPAPTAGPTAAPWSTITPPATTPLAPGPPDERGSQAPPTVRAGAPTTTATRPTAPKRNPSGPRAASDATSETASTPTTAPARKAIPVPIPVPVAPPPSTIATHHVVAPGESLWSIAAQHLREGTPDPGPTDTDVARYWAVVVATNRTALRSGNASLVFPGEVLQLPPTR